MYTEKLEYYGLQRHHNSSNINTPERKAEKLTRYCRSATSRLSIGCRSRKTAKIEIESKAEWKDKMTNNKHIIQKNTQMKCKEKIETTNQNVNSKMKSANRSGMKAQ